MFKQRWYMVAHAPGKGKTLIYSLDRIHALEPTTQRYKLPKDFDAERYFKNTYGVSFADDQPEEVKVKISAYQANFLRSLPIHASQEEIECNDEFSIFRYFVVPTFEFMQELRKYGSELEVLSPQSLRDEFIDEAGSLYSKYYREEEQA
jgi:predicted DNA-binding transcriptional regulator YafY